MSAWEASAARNDFRALLDAAAAGPQVVVRHGGAVAVVISPDEYRRLRHLAGAGMARFLASTPFEDGDVPPLGASLSGSDDEPSGAVEVVAGHGA